MLERSLIVFKSQPNGESKTENPEVKVDRSRLVLLGALAATAVAVAGCGGGRSGYGDNFGHGN
jgi:hypothetical protein